MKYTTKLFFWHGKGDWFSRAIRFYNKVKFKDENLPTHIGIVVDENGEIEIYEANPNGFVRNKYDKTWFEERIKDKTISIGKVKYKIDKLKLIKECEKYEGRPYAWYDIFKIALFFLTGFKGIYFTGAKQLICSEAVSRVLYDVSDGKIQLGYNPEQPEEKKLSEYKIPYDLISPTHLFKSKWVEIEI